MKKKHYIIASALMLAPMWGWADETLHYDRPAVYFEEALPIGNGNLGAMVYGGVGEDRLSLNDITLWTGEPQTQPFKADAWKALDEVRRLLDQEKYTEADRAYRAVEGYYSQSYQPLGTLTLTDMRWVDQPTPTDYRRVLSLDEATATVAYSTGGDGREIRTAFVSAPDSVIVMRLVAEGGHRLSKRIAFHSMLRHQTQARRYDEASAPVAPIRALEFVPVASQGGMAQLAVEGHCAYSMLPGYVRTGQREHNDDGRGMRFRTLVRVVLPAGGRLTVPYDDVIDISDAPEALILISNVTSYAGPERNPATQGRDYVSAVHARIDSAQARGYDDLLARHLADYQPLYRRVTLDLGSTASEIAQLPTDVQLRRYGDEQQSNPDLEELYFQYGRYLLIASSRTEGVPANLQGLWNEYITPPWSSNYTVNINVEENYWPAETAALPEMHRPLLTFIGHLARNGAATARHYYNVQRGWCAAHNSDIWALTNPVGMGGGDPSWACWPMGGAWISTHLWEHYAFSQDLGYLAEAYPVMRGAADFCMGWLVERDGWLMTSPSTSPEAKFIAPDGKAVATLYGGTADLAMIRECLIDSRAAAQVLGVDRAWQDTVTQTLERLYPYHVGKRGNLMEWYHDFDDQDWQHRHQSHLFGLYPGHHLSLAGTPELAAAAAKTLEIKGDRTTGWSTGWRVGLYARLHDGEQAYHIYRTLLSYVTPDEYAGPDRRHRGGTYPNLFDAHPPFQIDGNFGGCAGVIEMLVQSELGDASGDVLHGAATSGTPTVTLLPALPQQWASQGAISGVRVRGGYSVDFAWRDGRIVSLSVTSLRRNAGRLRIVMPDGKVRMLTLAPGRTRRL